MKLKTLAFLILIAAILFSNHAFAVAAINCGSRMSPESANTCGILGRTTQQLNKRAGTF